MTRRRIQAAASLVLASYSVPAARASDYDVVVYGGTAAGVVAAVAAAREGLNVALLEPGSRLGGMSSGGLGHTDRGVPETAGGYALEFYKRVGSKYGAEIAWDFEPHIAEAVFREMAREAKVTVLYEHRMREEYGIQRRKKSIREIHSENGTVVRAKVFIDATYEGDLMARARVSYTVGRESAAQYAEDLAGVRPLSADREFAFPVSGLDGNNKPLPDISGWPRGADDLGDKKVQAYGFRVCLSSNARNSVPFPKPANYEPARYETLLRYIEGFAKQYGREPKLDGDLFTFHKLPNGKADVASRGPLSLDLPGASWDYPDATYARRAEVWQSHIDYAAGLLYFLANDERVPKTIGDEARNWGLAADEFAASNHWPSQLHVREARRMIGDFVMTQKDIQTDTVKSDAIGVGAAPSVSAAVQRYFAADASVQNEGSFEAPVKPYQIPYRAMLPKKNQAVNLLVPVCVSASHVAYPALHTEPVQMILGHAAGVAAKLAIEGGVAVQDVDVKALAARLTSQGAVLEWKQPKH